MMLSEKKIRIGCGQGFWGDYLDAPDRLVASGKLDYLMLDYLAEVTMSILAKQHEKNSDHGYALDFPPLIGRISSAVSLGLKVIANAGGVNPKSAALQTRKILNQVLGEEAGNKIKIAIIEGDNLKSQLPELANLNIKSLDSELKIKEIEASLKSINAYIGCDSVVDALKAGASIVIVGRIADPCMCLAPLMYEYNWQAHELDKLAAGVIAGHIIECGTQSTGGNFSLNWDAINLDSNIGFPIVEFNEDGSFVVTKPEGTSGVVNVDTVTEQLVYEIGDPENYITPDVIADFTEIKLEEIAVNQVRVTGCRGKAKPDKLKISASYFDGYMAEGTLILVGPDVLKKATICEKIIRERIASLTLDIDEILFERLGAFSCIPGMEEKLFYPEPGEVVFRVAAKGHNKSDLSKLTREIAPLVLSGPSGITGYSGGKKDLKEIYSYFPSLVDRNFVSTKFEIV